MAYSPHAERARSVRAQIASLRAEPSIVLTEQNTLSPIGRTPDDVLVSIFAQIVSSTEPLEEDRGVESLKLSYVCRHWRAVALDFPALWTNIFIGNVKRAKVFLNRSRMSLLSITAKPSYGETLDGLGSFLAPHIHRIRRLDLYNWFDSTLGLYHTEWMDEFNTGAPALEDFRLTFYSPHNDHLAQDGQEMKMFGACTPRLRSVALAWVAYPPSTFLFHNLSRLELDAVYTPSLPLNALLEILQRSPSLESLQLTLTHESRDPAHDVSALQVGLPRLSDLRIVGLPEFLMLLLPHLTLPPTVSIHVHLGLPDCRFPDFRPLFPALTRVRHIRQMVAPDSGTRFAYADGEDGTRAPVPVFEVAVDYFDDEEAYVWLPKLAVLCDMDRLLSCELLDVHALLLRADTWIPYFARMPALRELRVVGVPAEENRAAPVRLALLSKLRLDKNNYAAPARLALFGALAGDAEMCPALERLEFDWPWEDEEGLASGLEALSARRPSLVVIRREAHLPLFVF